MEWYIDFESLRLTLLKELVGHIKELRIFRGSIFQKAQGEYMKSRLQILLRYQHRLTVTLGVLALTACGGGTESASPTAELKTMPNGVNESAVKVRYSDWQSRSSTVKEEAKYEKLNRDQGGARNFIANPEFLTTGLSIKQGGEPLEINLQQETNSADAHSKCAALKWYVNPVGYGQVTEVSPVRLRISVPAAAKREDLFIRIECGNTHQTELIAVRPL